MPRRKSRSQAMVDAFRSLFGSGSLSYFTDDSVEGALSELATQIGGTTSATYNFTNGTGTRLADNDTVYAALNKLDQGFVDLKSTANAKGASLVGIEDAATLITATTVETALAEFALKFPLTLADPGTGAAIPVTRSASVAITQNGAETNTLADPTFRGQVMVLFVDTDTSGARVVTAASRINQAGNTIITMTEVGDYIRLEAITIGAALKWQVVANDGCVLS